MTRAKNTDVREGAHAVYEVDSDSDYEEEGPADARTDGSVQRGNVPGHNLLPGAFTT